MISAVDTNILQLSIIETGIKHRGGLLLTPPTGVTFSCKSGYTPRFHEIAF